MNTALNSKTEENGEEVVEEVATSEVDKATLEEMIKAGVFYGRKKSKTNPKMKRYIFGTRNAIEIVDLSETLKLLGVAKNFLEELFKVKPKAQILLVGTHPSAEEAIKTLGKKFSFPIVVTRWIGGTLTNFKTINARIQKFKDLKSKKASGALEKYTKKEQVMFAKEIERMERIFSGIENMTELPDALLVINAKIHEAAIKEAIIAKIPVMAVLNTDTNPALIDFPIPSNDGTKHSINWISSYFDKIFEEVRK